MNGIRHFDNRALILELGDSHIVEVPPHGQKLLDVSSKTNILNTTRDFFFKPKSLMKDPFEAEFLHFYLDNLICTFRH